MTHARRAHLLGLAMLAALIAMAAFAGVAQASSVTGLTVDNAVPTAAAGAKTVYKISFNTTAGPLSGTDKITINFEAPADPTTAVGSSVRDNTTNTTVGNCSESGLTATCGL